MGMSDPARRDAAGAKPANGNTTPPRRTGTLVGGRFRIKQEIWRESGVELLRASDAQSGDDVALLIMTPPGPARALLERELAKAQRLGGHKNLAAALGVVSEGKELIVAHE